MPDPITGLIVGGSQLIGGLAQSSAARSAAGAQERATEAGIEEQRRQFEAMRNILAPYVQAGTGAIGGLQPYQQAGAGQIAGLEQYAAAGVPAFEQQQALAGLRGPEAQQAAISQIEQSPFLQSQMEQGERALLQRASATGGLRGGNIQAALAQFRPQMLQQAIEQQYGRLGGIAGVGGTAAQNLMSAGLGSTELIARLGQAAAGGQAAGASTLGQNVSNLMQQQGAAQAGARLAGAAPLVGLSQIPGQLAGYQMVTGKNVFGNLFGGSAGVGSDTSGMVSGDIWPSQYLS